MCFPVGHNQQYLGWGNTFSPVQSCKVFFKITVINRHFTEFYFNQFKQIWD